jgi:hypothetical protein
VKCELVKLNEEAEHEVLFEGVINCDPEECQIVLHKGQTFVHCPVEDEEFAVYVLTAVAEFTEAKD